MPKRNNNRDEGNYAETNMQEFMEWLDSIHINPNKFRKLEFSFGEDTAELITNLISTMFDDEISIGEEGLINILSNGNFEIKTDVLYKIATILVAFNKFHLLKSMKYRQEKERYERQDSAWDGIENMQDLASMVEGDIKNKEKEYENGKEDNEENEKEGNEAKDSESEDKENNGADVIDYETFLKRKEERDNDNNNK